MRDLETIDAAVTAAETGHLVFGTLHKTGAAKIDRLVTAFPTNQQEQIRIQLSTVLQAVISQLLIPRIDKPGRVAIFEIMINTPSVAALIRDNKLSALIRTSRRARIRHGDAGQFPAGKIHGGDDRAGEKSSPSRRIP